MSVEFREQVINSLQRAQPIYYCRPQANGDKLIHLWAHQFYLIRLGGELGLEQTNLQLRSYPRNRPPQKGVVDFGDYPNLNGTVENLHKIGVLGYKLQTVAQRLNMAVNPDDLTLIPQPSLADFNPWTRFNKDRVLIEGQNHRDRILKESSRIVVIAQFGSSAEKRFSDSQAVDLTKIVKTQDPDSFVAVISDKDHLKSSLPKLWHWITRPDSYYGFPYYTREFRSSLKNRHYENIPDELVFGTDIQKFCNIFYASDLLITTDSFGSWLGCGARSLREDRKGRIQPQDAVVLHTVANPDVWGIPGVTIVTSPKLYLKQIMTGSRFDFIGHDEYYRGHFKQGEITSGDPRRGILQQDIDILAKVLRSLTFAR